MTNNGERKEKRPNSEHSLWETSGHAQLRWGIERVRCRRWLKSGLSSKSCLGYSSSLQLSCLDAQTGYLWLERQHFEVFEGFLRWSSRLEQKRVNFFSNRLSVPVQLTCDHGKTVISCLMHPFFSFLWCHWPQTNKNALRAESIQQKFKVKLN